MARDRQNNQRLGVHQGFGLMEDAGFVSFTGTELTVTISTTLRHIVSWLFEVATITDHVVERFYISSPTISDNGFFLDPSNDLVITRAVEPILLGSALPLLASNNVAVNAIGLCPVAGTLDEAWYYNETTEGGGSGLINIGSILTNGTGTNDPDFHLANAKAEAVPGDDDGKAITVFTSSVVAADSILTASTTGGGTSAPAGTHCQLKITPTVTEDLAISYRLMGN